MTNFYSKETRIVENASLCTLHPPHIEAALFMDCPKRSITNVVENEEHERVSLPPAFENETSLSETEIKEGELAVNQVLEGNAQEMSSKNTPSFKDKCSRSMTNIDEVVSLPHTLLNIENETSGKFY